MAKAKTKKKPAAKKKAESKKSKTVSLLERIQKKQKKTSAALLSGGSNSEVKAVIPTGIDVVDHHILGIGGWPCGRIAEIYGGEGTGKSSLIFQTIAQAQLLGFPVLFVETENAIEGGRIHSFGVNLDEVILEQSEHIEGVIEFIEDSLESMYDDEPCLLAWDSIAETPSRRERLAEKDSKGKLKKEMPGERAKALSRLVRIVKSRLAKKQVAALFVNQMRDKPGVMFGEKTTTPGGHGVKYGSSIRLGVFGGAEVKQGDRHIGKAPIIRCVKNKHSPPRREARVRLIYDQGWDNLWTTINYAKDMGCIDKGLRVTEKNYAEAKEALNW
jgi:recombination protein RecA